MWASPTTRRCAASGAVPVGPSRLNLQPASGALPVSKLASWPESSAHPGPRQSPQLPAWQLGSPVAICSRQAELGDLVHTELPEVGSSIAAGDPFGVVESVKVRQRAHPEGRELTKP